MQTMYRIQKAAPVLPVSHVRKSSERIVLEALEVGEGFVVDESEAMMRVHNARKQLRPKKFTIRKLGGRGWQVRREE